MIPFKNNQFEHIKPGVKIDGLGPEILLAHNVAMHIWSHFGQFLVITSGKDSEHSRVSAHYRGDALDFRSRYFDVATKKSVVKALKQALGKDFYVLSEATHIHVEFKPYFK